MVRDLVQDSVREMEVVSALALVWDSVLVMALALVGALVKEWAMV